METDWTREEGVRVSLVWGRGEAGPVPERGGGAELCLGHSDSETRGSPQGPEDVRERLKLRTEL